MLARIADNTDHLHDLFDLDHATNDRLLGEHNLLPGIGVHELLFDVPYARIVNAAFCHAHPLGSRFNSPDRGAWYAAFAQETAIAEIAFHKTTHLAEIGRFEDDVTYDDYLSDIHAPLFDLRGGGQGYTLMLDPESYVASQALAMRLLDVGGLGVVYPSVRHLGGTCLACFRPAVVSNVRKGKTIAFRWDGDVTPIVSVE